jgi:hypothetical protein
MIEEFYRRHDWTQWFRSSHELLNATSAVLVISMWLFALYQIWRLRY